MIMNIDFVYPIGSIYLSINSTNPSKWFGGTWTQITSDAYLKIVTSNAGSLGGTSSNHKIPISSMPSHSHTGGLSCYAGGGGANVFNFTPANVTNSPQWSNSLNIGSSGGGQAYYPYYYGVYVWKRTA